MRLLSFTMLCLSTALCVASLCAQDTPPQKKGGGGGQPHKNLKILKDDEVRPAMAAFRTALGVQCTHCHVASAGGPPDFASDDNPKKNVARMMLGLVHDVNAKFADGKEHVTCYTCHRGAATPLTAAPPAAPGQ